MSRRKKKIRGEKLERQIDFLKAQVSAHQLTLAMGGRLVARTLLQCCSRESISLAGWPGRRSLRGLPRRLRVSAQRANLALRNVLEATIKTGLRKAGCGQFRAFGDDVRALPGAGLSASARRCSLARRPIGQALRGSRRGTRAGRRPARAPFSHAR